MSPVDRQNILRNLRDALSQQRERLFGYLAQLERQERAVFEEDLAALREHVQIEQQAMVEMGALKRVIDPLEELYAAAYLTHERSVPALRQSLETVHGKVMARNAANQRLLQERLMAVREEIQGLRARTTQASPFASIDAPSMLDVRA